NSFWDIFVTNFTISGLNNGITPGLINGTSQFSTRLDNAFLPANVAAAIAGNTFMVYDSPNAATPDQPGAPLGLVAAPIANHRGFGLERSQTNNREGTRWVAGLEGNWDPVGFIDNVTGTLHYVKGEMNNINREEGPDAIRFAHAMDSVVDFAGVVNGA